MALRTPHRIRNKLKDIVAKTDGAQYLENRNPRNLERLRIGYKPNGYFLEKPGKCFWNK